MITCQSIDSKIRLQEEISLLHVVHKQIEGAVVSPFFFVDPGAGLEETQGRAELRGGDGSVERGETSTVFVVDVGAVLYEVASEVFESGVWKKVRVMVRVRVSTGHEWLGDARQSETRGGKESVCNHANMSTR